MVFHNFGLVPGPGTAVCTLSLLLLAGCGGPAPQPAAEPPKMPEFTRMELVKGRSVWMESCRACHLLGVGDAPGVADYAAWAPRLTKERSVLYRSVFEGVTDAKGVIVKPPRGGNPRLSDGQLRWAVDYMVEAVGVLHQGG